MKLEHAKMLVAEMGDDWDEDDTPAVIRFPGVG